MVRLPENHELPGRVECAPVRAARCMGVSSPTYGTANSRRSEASLPFAVSLADGASLPHSLLGHRTFIGGVFLWSALCAGKTCEWHRSEEHTSELQSRENLV